MKVGELIESGLLELYVFGKTSDEETALVNEMAAEHKTVRDEILSIEKAVISLSFSMAPYLSADNYYRIREQLIEKHGVIELQRGTNWAAYVGWAAAMLLLAAGIYQYTEVQSRQDRIEVVQEENTKLKDNLKLLDENNKSSETILNVIRDQNTQVVVLGGQAVAPDAKAKVYWNQSTQQVYIDASQLPTPPPGKVYQVWSLTLNPLTPTSIGLLDRFDKNATKFFPVSATGNAQAFGITLEPEGGSPTPTMEQLYVLGTVS
ncbi:MULTISPECIES: anti-sigma factor domain-containing protein [unclassified Flavobacterium]|uniref:anti-sigma factor n=1 Tax=unclassified Flavobacterium TaxID=196869 RepID=UPI001F12A61A|nr:MULTISPECIES: anti-sigma factor [unclassified Flavobacterium]UMY65159.1 anti-sigma factor [Flavobacterium sp. HJ-32-4]